MIRAVKRGPMIERIVAMIRKAKQIVSNLYEPFNPDDLSVCFHSGLSLMATLYGSTQPLPRL